MFDYTLEHLFSYSASLSEPELIGEVHGGLRVNIYVTGGEVTGSALQGRILPVGGDWLTLREDGTALLDVRATIQSHDAALIEVVYNGIADLGEDGYQRFLDGALPESVPIRAAPRFRSAHANYRWLNRLQCVNIGAAEFGKGRVAYDTYALR